ncbi:hypothetical protein F5883DRAFT_589628 [Diaporthe sp. PMI_573]|nr:hypothetical protein F5883DRAFT_589628 [Diaporthaceae sp. PMI_573]
MPAPPASPAASEPPVLCDVGRDLLDRLHVSAAMRSNRAVSILSRSPVRRELAQRNSGRRLPPLIYTHRVVAVLVQATGFERQPPCNRCMRENGPWNQCVVAQTTEPLQTTKGACANCCWNNQCSLCSFRTRVRSQLTGSFLLTC